MCNVRCITMSGLFIFNEYKCTPLQILKQTGEEYSNQAKKKALNPIFSAYRQLAACIEKLLCNSMRFSVHYMREKLSVRVFTH